MQEDTNQNPEPGSVERITEELFEANFTPGTHLVAIRMVMDNLNERFRNFEDKANSKIKELNKRLHVIEEELNLLHSSLLQLVNENNLTTTDILNDLDPSEDCEEKGKEDETDTEAL